MRIKITRVLLAAALALSLGVAAQGQTPSDEELVNQYRGDIQLLVDNPPPAGASEKTKSDYTANLRSLRGKLRELLVEKRGVFKDRVRNLQAPNPTPERQAVVAQLDADLQSVVNEIQGIDRDLGPGAEAAPVGDTRPAPRGAPETRPRERRAGERSAQEGSDTQPTDVRAAERAAFDAAVNNISPEDLREAAAPPEVAENKLPAPATCNDVGRPGSTTFSTYDGAVCRIAFDLVEQDRQDDGILLEQDQAPLFFILIAKLLKTTGDGSYARFISDAQEARTDQQMGAGPSSSGTTSLVSKGGIPYAFGFAVENGATVQSFSDTTTTFRINPAGLYDLATSKGFITGFRESENNDFKKFLRKTSVGLTFDTARGSDPGFFTGNRDQLSEVNVKLEIFNERDPRHKRYERDWERFLNEAGVQLAEQINATTLATTNFGGPDDKNSLKDAALQAWLKQTNALVVNAGAGLSGTEKVNAIATVIRAQANLLPVDIVSKETVDAITGFAAGFTAYERSKSRLLDKIAKGKVLTFEYTNKREVNAPDTSNLNFVYATGAARRIDLTANGSLTFFHQTPAPATPATPASPAPGKIRDFQFAVQGDVPFDLKKLGVTSQVVLWFSGRFERLMEDASDPSGATVADTKGNIAVGQVGIKIPIGKSGFQLPFSLTFANRTELIKEKTVRGNLGFTFNLDSILARFKPF